MELKQYQIVLVNLSPTVGAEIRKTRPCVILSPDEMNDHIRTVVIAPMTTTSKPYPTRVKVKHDNKIGYVIIDQIRTVDKKRIIKILDQLTRREIKAVKEVIAETFVR